MGLTHRMGIPGILGRQVEVANPGPNTENEREHWCRVFMKRWTAEPTETQLKNFKWLCDNQFYLHTVRGEFVKRYAQRWLVIRRDIFMSLAHRDFVAFVKQHEFLAANPVDEKIRPA